MIKGFETETKPLTEDEAKTLPWLITGFNNHKGEDNAITASNIISSMRLTGTERDMKTLMKFNGARLRKLVNHIRREGLIKELVSTSKGYWVETDREKIKDCITSMHQRATAIQAVSSAMAMRWNNNENQTT